MNAHWAVIIAAMLLHVITPMDRLHVNAHMDTMEMVSIVMIIMNASMVDMIEAFILNARILQVATHVRASQDTVGMV